MNTSDPGIPDDFAPLFRTSPLLDTLGPFYGKGTGTDLVVGFRVIEKHTNSRGTLHGGVIATISDVALGYATASSTEPPRRLLTASLNVDYTGSAKIGDWVEVRADSMKIGKTLAFANAYLTVSGKQIARASAVFAVVKEAGS